MSKRSSAGSVGPWAREKLESLGAYLDYYTKVLKNQRWLRGTWFVDAFAGAGISQIRRPENPQTAGPLLLFDNVFESPAEADQVECVKGSPRVALELANPFSRYVFIERVPELARELETLKAEFPDRSIDIRSGDANEELQRFLSLRIDRRTSRGVVFLDPFGMNVPWTTVVGLAEARWLEVIINFPLHMAIDRLLTRTAEIPETWQVRLDATFGSDEWRDLVYEKHADLLGDATSKREDAASRILKWYRGRLRAAFGHVSPAQLISNTKGNPLYYLIWAGPHAKGLVGADYILGRKRRKVEQPGRGG